MQKGFEAVNLHGTASGVIAVPVIGEKGNWWIGNEDTGIAARGSQGEQGVPGPQGSKGDKGDKGETGSLGLQGVQGNTGAAGAQGLKGEKGDIGTQGLKGDKGDTGIQGNVGQLGPQGERGPAGIQGPKGEKGDTGIQGITGPAGPQGAKGEQGIKGLKGDKGDTGIPGLAGPQGIQGEKGNTGVQGTIGPTGPQGLQGLQGSKGADADRGDIERLDGAVELLNSNLRDLKMKQLWYGKVDTVTTVQLSDHVSNYDYFIVQGTLNTHQMARHGTNNLMFGYRANQVIYNDAYTISLTGTTLSIDGIDRFWIGEPGNGHVGFSKGEAEPILAVFGIKFTQVK